MDVYWHIALQMAEDTSSLMSSNIKYVSRGMRLFT